MLPSETQRALAAAMSTASALDLTVDDAIVPHDSNKLAVRLLPCDVLARVAPTAHQVAQFEVELAQRLAETGSPVAALEPRLEPRVGQPEPQLMAPGLPASTSTPLGTFVTACTRVGMSVCHASCPLASQ